MGLDLTILVGSMTGTADVVAQEVLAKVSSAGHTATVLDMNGLDFSLFLNGGAFLICSSTYGNGDVPDNARDLYESLEAAKHPLAGVTYGVIALGDRTYGDTYCQGGRRFDEVLTRLGARRAGEILFHDASAGTFPEDVAAEWVLPWLERDLLPALEACSKK